jgi:hypothetical protein
MDDQTLREGHVLAKDRDEFGAAEGAGEADQEKRPVADIAEGRAERFSMARRSSLRVLGINGTENRVKATRIVQKPRRT